MEKVNNLKSLTADELKIVAMMENTQIRKVYKAYHNRAFINCKAIYRRILKKIGTGEHIGIS